MSLINWIVPRVATPTNLDPREFYLIVKGEDEIIVEEVMDILLCSEERFSNVYMLSLKTSNFKVINSRDVASIIGCSFTDCYVTAKAMSELTSEDKRWILKRMRLKYLNKSN